MPGSEPSLEPLATPTGTFCLLALDHRDALRNAYRAAGVADVDAQTMLAVKSRIARVLGSHASGILLDFDAVGCRPPEAGLLTPLEAQGYELLDGARLSRLEFDAARAQQVGADGCKLLLWYRADHPASAERQRDLLARAAEECHRHGLPLVLEPLVYRLEGESEAAYASAFADLVVAAATELHDCDLLKLQFPGDDACARATAAAAPLRWALLGGSATSGDEFAAQLETACLAGAAGFIAGRAIWAGTLGLPPELQEPWLRKEALPLFDQLVGIAETLGPGGPEGHPRRGGARA